MSQTPTPRRPRKDAQQNRAHILEVARKAFVADGVEVSMDAIATQASVGPGTLYRHFPSKDALLAALLDAHYDDLAHQLRVIKVEETAPDRILERWIEALGDWMLIYDGLSEPLRAGWSRANAPLSSTCHGVIETTDQILRAAQAGGAVRAGLTGRDIFLAALAVAWATGSSAAEGGSRNALREIFKNGWAARV